MPSISSHALVAVALGTALRPAKAPPRFWLLGMTCAVLPDADSLGFYFGVPYGHMFGHRGLTHSLAFASVVGGLVLLVAFRHKQWRVSQRRLLFYFFLTTASHGILDAMTNGGRGIAFFAPFDSSRYFFPYRPVEVAPLSARAFFTDRGLTVLASEMIWIWLPSLLLVAGVLLLRRFRSHAGSGSSG